MRGIFLLFLLGICSFAYPKIPGDSGLSLTMHAYQGLESLRNPFGMISNVALVGTDDSIKIHDETYAPTDVGLDLLIQLAALDYPELKARALVNLTRVLANLKSLKRHAGGQFYRSYSEKQAVNLDISSIDNLHLALGLWAVAQYREFPFSQEAERLFSSMDLSGFYDAKLQRIGGNLRESGGEWTLEAYRYGLNSEARSLYFLGYALNLFKNAKGGSDALLGAISSLPVEVCQSPAGRYLRVWDGGLFQSALPTLLVNEPRYHSFFAESQQAVWRLLDPGRGDVPQASSASLTRVGKTPEGKVDLNYDGKAGLGWLKSSSNPDTIEEKLFVPHAFLLAGLANPQEALIILERVAKVLSTGKRTAFIPHFGWISAIAVPDAPSCLNAMVAEGITGVDKAMEVLSLFSYRDADRHSPSARLLWENPVARSRLMRAFAAISL